MTADQYLKDHGINAESVKRFHITSDDNQLNIPIKNVDDQIIWTKHRNLQYDPDNVDSKKYINDTGSKAALFNIRSHSTKKTIIMTEGEIDAIKLDQEGIPAISPTAGAETFNRELANQLESKTVYIVYDNDEAGKKGIRKVLEFIPQAKILELPLDSKDVCDFFTLHTKQDFIDILKHALTKEEWAMKYQPEEYSTISESELYKQEFPEEQWLIDKIVPQTGIVLFVGEAGVGKSFIALEAARSLSTGQNFLGNFEVKTQGKVLIIDKENGLKRLQRRMVGLQIPPSDNIHLLKYSEQFTLDKEEFMQSVSNFIHAQSIKLIILDSFIDVLIGSENDAGDNQQVISAIKSISPNVCWFILHHDSKPMPKTTRSAAQKTRGSSNIIGQVDNQFYIEKTKSPTVINIEQGKSRDMEPVKKFQLEFTSNEAGDMTGFRYIGELKEDVKLIEEVTELVFEFLQSAGATDRQSIVLYIEQKGYTERTTKDALASLVTKGLINLIKKKGQGNKSFYLLASDQVSDVEY